MPVGACFTCSPPPSLCTSPRTRRIRLSGGVFYVFTSSLTCPSPQTCKTHPSGRALHVRHLPHPAHPLEHVEHARLGVCYMFAISLTLPVTITLNTKNTPIWACFRVHRRVVTCHYSTDASYYVVVVKCVFNSLIYNFT
jgi:hypothetical protein